MIRKKIHVIFTCTALMFFGSLTASGQEDTKVSIGFININWMPFSYENQGSYKGFALDVISRVFSQMRTGIKFERKKLAEGMERIKLGNLDAFVGITPNEERRKTFIFSNEPIYYDETVLISRGDDPFVFNGDVSTLIGEKIVIINGSIHGPAFDNMHGIIRIPRAGREFRNEQLYQELFDGKFRFIASNARYGIEHLLNSINLSGKVKTHKQPIAIKPYFLAFSRHLPNAQDLADRFDRVHQLFRSSPNYKLMLDKYKLNKKLFPK